VYLVLALLRVALVNFTLNEYMMMARFMNRGVEGIILFLHRPLVQLSAAITKNI